MAKATAKAKAKGGQGTPATVALTREGIEFTIHAYTHAPDATSYGEEAATALGVPPERVFKTLMADVDGKLTIAVVPVAGKLDLKALAAATGAKRATMADPAAAERATGYVLGGISPLGQKRPHPTVIDISAQSHPTIYISAGRRGLEIELPPTALITLTNAKTAQLARP
ncbi:Cys-tRNA(Pro) deacylase [Embleya sp. AB8]|uniref:Cys-tRNA(Pro) deacylase n=1 Tax=Embleya sp. AB8 TaxID=3156304 RepID=UPI003C755A67